MVKVFSQDGPMAISSNYTIRLRESCTGLAEAAEVFVRHLTHLLYNRSKSLIQNYLV